jgi:hypothetical protein
MYERYQGERVTTELLCRPELARHPVPRVPVRGPGIVVALAACLLLASVLVLFFQVRGFLDHIETRLIAESSGVDIRLRAMGQQMEALRGKFHGLLAESVEMRLKSLEKIVESGKVSADDLRAFEELQKDLKALENYAGTSGVGGLDYPAQEHSRFRPMAQPQVVHNTGLMAEVVELKTLFYFCLVGIAVSAVAMVGYYWIRQRRHARYIHDLVGAMPMLPHQSPDGGS